MPPKRMCVEPGDEGEIITEKVGNGCYKINLAKSKRKTGNVYSGSGIQGEDSFMRNVRNQALGL